MNHVNPREYPMVSARDSQLLMVSAARGGAASGEPVELSTDQHPVSRNVFFFDVLYELTILTIF